MPPFRLLVLFFASGAAGLIYQVIWMRALALTLSVSVYAVTTVLCAFMGGLALGAWLAGRIADRLERPLIGFGLAEIGVGMAGLGTLGVLFDLGPAYAWLHALLGGAGLPLVFTRFLLASSVLLVPCTLMGMTLPLLSRAVIGSQGAVGRGAGGLYSVNTLGAVAGCIAAGFGLIPALGLSATTQVAAVINLGVGLCALLLGWRTPRLPRAPSATGMAPGAMRPGLSARLAALAFGVSGFTAIGYEVLWTRALEQFTHNSTYAYSAMLASFLLGIALGSAAAAATADRVRRPLVWLGAIEIAAGASVLASLLVYMRLLHWMPVAVEAMGGIHSWPHAIGMIFGVTSVTLLVTAFLFGATFPFVARAVVHSLDQVGRRIAYAYTLNTLGSIGGAIVVGFAILPLVGVRGSFVTLIAINLALGAGLVMWTAPFRLGLWAGAIAVAVAAASFAALPPDLFRGIFLERYGKLLMYREQVTDIVMVTEDAHGGRLIRYGDGRGTAGTVSFQEDRSYAHTALMLHPNPRRILNICFGVGNSLSSVAQYPVERIDQVELSPGVVYAASFFRQTNRDVLADPRVHLTIEDGRNYLLASGESYDVIRLDPPELHTAGIVNLYTKEFFELARDHLAPGGIFSIWVNIAYTPEAEMKMILRTAVEAFPYVSVWHSPWLYSWVINGSVEPRPPDMSLLTRYFADPRIKADLESIPIRSPFDFLNRFVMAGDEVREFAGAAPIITDDHTRLDFSVPRSKESFFGIANSITDYYLTDAKNSQSSVIERAARYCVYKRPVFPHLVNLEASGLTPTEVQARLKSLVGSLPAGGCVGSAQAEVDGQRR